MKKYEQPTMEFIFITYDVVTSSLTNTGTNLDTTNPGNESGDVSDIFG